MKPLVANIPDGASAAEIERERMERFTREMNDWFDERLEQFRAVNPRALLLILYKIRRTCSSADAVVAAFPYLQGFKWSSLEMVWRKLVDNDPDARFVFEELNNASRFLQEAVSNRRIRLDGSMMRHITDKMNWMLSPLGLVTVRAEAARLPHIMVRELKDRAPSVRSQLLALGIPA